MEPNSTIYSTKIRKITWSRVPSKIHWICHRIRGIKIVLYFSTVLSTCNWPSCKLRSIKYSHQQLTIFNDFHFPWRFFRNWKRHASRSRKFLFKIFIAVYPCNWQRLSNQSIDGDSFNQRCRTLCTVPEHCYIIGKHVNSSQTHGTH